MRMKRLMREAQRESDKAASEGSSSLIELSAVSWDSSTSGANTSTLRSMFSFRVASHTSNPASVARGVDRLTSG